MILGGFQLFDFFIRLFGDGPESGGAESIREIGQGDDELIGEMKRETAVDRRCFAP
jgi:hypothetical protein